MAANVDRVEIGFVEKVESHLLESIFFPSKIGGKPAWLAQNCIPPLEDLRCIKCGRLMSFLLQVYAARSEKADCFHRTIYLFLCQNPECFSKNSNLPFKAFRSQLPRENDFFDFNPTPDETDKDLVLEIVEKMRTKWGALCEVCGYRGDKRCAACKLAMYCSKEHQVLDWKNGHKDSCSGSKQADKKADVMYITGYNQRAKREILLPEFEIDIDTEESFESDAKSLAEKPAGELEETTNDIETEGVFAEIVDKQFEKFKQIISKDPDQVLRYQYGGDPTWISCEHQAKPSDIPNCFCGAKRIPEFQVLPQLLNYLDLNSLEEGIDFGTLVIYTCSNNCTPGSSYVKEFVWKQDFSDDHINFK